MILIWTEEHVKYTKQTYVDVINVHLRFLQFFSFCSLHTSADVIVHEERTPHLFKSYV